MVSDFLFVYTGALGPIHDCWYLCTLYFFINILCYVSTHLLLTFLLSFLRLFENFSTVLIEPPISQKKLNNIKYTDSFSTMIY